MPDAPRILVVSLGSIGRRHLRNARHLLPQARIAVWRRAGELPEGADAIVHDLDAALAFKPDAVIVASPASEHVRMSTPFVKAGAPLFLEKPLAATSEGIAPLLDAARGAKGFVMVGYVLRFLPLLGHLRELIRKGTLGKVRTARVQVGQYLPDWRPGADYREGVSARKALGGGALLELSHELDYATWLFGRPRSLLCSAATLSGLEIDVEDSAHVVLEYEAARVLVQLDFLQRAAHMSVEIVGSEATLRADLIKETARIHDAARPDGADLEVPPPAPGNEIYLRQFDFFFSKCFPSYRPVRAGTAGFRDWADLEQAARVLRLVDRAKAASAEGRRLDIEDA